MASNKKQPIALVKAKGRKHLTKAEIEKREKEEVRVDLKDVRAPDHLPYDLLDEFNDLAGKLLGIGIMTELDEESLARYLLAKVAYLTATEVLLDVMGSDRIDLDKIQDCMTFQDKAFKQVRTAAGDLGLTISSRCKLVLPPTQEKPKENKFSKFAGT